MNADLSVAPEIAQLAVSVLPARRDGAQPAGARPRTVGRLAGDLADLAAAPERWWDRVRFDSAGPVRIPVPDLDGGWLLVLPPGAAADCDCRLATALAGEAVEIEVGAIEAGKDQPRPLRPGRVRVHGAGAPHRLRAAGPGYSVTLHARLAAAVPNQEETILLSRAGGGQVRLLLSLGPLSGHPAGVRAIITPGDALARGRRPD